MNIFYFGLMLVLYYAFHSFLADNKVKTWVIKTSIISASHYRLGYNMVAVLTLLLLVIYYPSVPKVALWKPILWVELVGYGLFFLGILLLYLALRNYNLSEFSGTQQLREGQLDANDNRLITNGLNAYVRHPLYFATLILLWGFFLLTGHQVSLVIAVISTIYLIVGSILEEKKLCQLYGITYQNYQKEVPMLLPFLTF